MCVADGLELFQYLNVAMGSYLLPFNHVIMTSKIVQLEAHFMSSLAST